MGMMDWVLWERISLGVSQNCFPAIEREKEK